MCCAAGTFFAIKPLHLKDIKVDGVVFEGKWFAAQKKAGPAH